MKGGAIHPASAGRGAGRASARAARAFTIVELSIVVLVIIILAGILMVSLRGAMGSARQANTERFLGTVVQAVEQFKNDLTYYPPLLAVEGGATGVVELGLDPPDSILKPQVIVPEALAEKRNPGSAPAVIDYLQKTRFGSEFTLATYLMGIGDVDNHETGAASSPKIGASTPDDDGNAGPGFRNPGPDRAWGGAADRQDQRSKFTATKTGRVYGPYLDPGATEKFLALDVKGRTGMWKLVDPWGQPLRYYVNWPRKDRTPLPQGGPQPSVDYTPVELRTQDSVQAQIDDPTGAASLDMDRQVFTASFMILSAGEPRLKDADGKAIARFGDRDTSDVPIQDLTRVFDPKSLSEELQREMLRDLGASIRGTP